MIKNKYLRKVVGDGCEITTKMVKEAELLEYIDSHENFDVFVARQMTALQAAPLSQHTGLGTDFALYYGTQQFSGLYQNSRCPYCGK